MPGGFEVLLWNIHLPLFVSVCACEDASLVSLDIWLLFYPVPRIVSQIVCDRSTPSDHSSFTLTQPQLHKDTSCLSTLKMIISYEVQMNSAGFKSLFTHAMETLHKISILTTILDSSNWIFLSGGGSAVCQEMLHNGEKNLNFKVSGKMEIRENHLYWQ